MADNINTRAIVYDMLMSVEKENTPSHLLFIPDIDEVSVSGQEGQSVYQQTFQRNIGI